ncbi:MAG: ATP-binding protein [Caulobacteraceae bacterium]
MAAEFDAPPAGIWRFAPAWLRGAGAGPVRGEPALPPASPALPFEAMLEAAPDPVLLVAEQESGGPSSRRAIYANDAARALFRIPPEGALLASVIRHPEALDVVERCLEAGAEANAAFDFGGPPARSWRAWARPLTDGGGRRLAMLMLRDETAARRNELMRADFLANASHELRTPLASLMGFIETLQGPARDDPAARERFLGIMAGQAARMARLVEGLLSLSRVEMNEHVPPTDICDLPLIVADVIAALAPLAKERGVQVVLSAPPPGTVKVVAERDQIIQVVQNLIDNALKYSVAGQSVEVSIRSVAALDEALAADADNGRNGASGRARMTLLTPDRTQAEAFALLRVEDHGPGIAREHLARLSERFYRVEGQKSGERSGTGLGLAIVKHIINRHRGALAIESTPGAGATFTAAFPVSPAE